MQIKIALFMTVFVPIFCLPSYCMEQNIFSTDQVHILLAQMRENPSSFNSLAREIAHTMYQRNPNISRSELINFFRVRDVSHTAVLPLEFVSQIWQFIGREQWERFVNMWEEDLCNFVLHSCEYNQLNQYNPNFANPANPFAGHFIDPTNPNPISYYSRESVSPLHHYSTPEKIISIIAAETWDVFKQLHLFYGKNRAILIVNDKTTIFVISNIAYVPRDAVTLKTDNQTTTGAQLINNIRNACTHCQQFTSWEQVHKMLERLDLSQY